MYIKTAVMLKQDEKGRNQEPTLEEVARSLSLCANCVIILYKPNQPLRNRPDASQAATNVARAVSDSAVSRLGVKRESEMHIGPTASPV